MKYVVVGATGLVGQAMVACLLRAGIPSNAISCIASLRSAGKTLSILDTEFIVQALEKWTFGENQIALFSAGGDISKQWVPVATQAGAIVIDNSSIFRLDKDVPLLVPEINPECLEAGIKRRLIANPNCSTIQLVVALKPLLEKFGLTSVNVSTYQAISGAGSQAVNTFKTGLVNQGVSFLNCLPSIDLLQDNGYSKEEMKVVYETQKILGLPTLEVNVTAVRVPILNGHSEAVSVTCATPVSLEECIECLQTGAGLQVYTGGNIFTVGQLGDNNPLVHISRIRKSLFNDHTVHFWVVADNLLKGAAYNSVQIAKHLTNQLVASN